MILGGVEILFFFLNTNFLREFSIVGRYETRPRGDLLERSVPPMTTKGKTFDSPNIRRKRKRRNVRLFWVLKAKQKTHTLTWNVRVYCGQRHSSDRADCDQGQGRKPKRRFGPHFGSSVRAYRKECFCYCRKTAVRWKIEIRCDDKRLLGTSVTCSRSYALLC